MGFFKDFKSDLSQAVSELVADEELKAMTEKENEAKEKLPKADGVVMEPDSDEDMELLKQLIAEDTASEEKEPVDVEETVVEDPEDAKLEEAIDADAIEAESSADEDNAVKEPDEDEEAKDEAEAEPAGESDAEETLSKVLE